MNIRLACALCLLTPVLQLQAAGINHVFDRDYACPVNRTNSDPFNPRAIQVNEPGREYRLRLSARF